MNRARYIFRVVFLLLIVIQLVYLNRKTDDTRTIAEFKFKMLEKIRTDSLDAKHKLDLLLNETTKFIDNSSHVREGIHYLMLMLGLLVASELSFFLLEKRNYGRQEIQ